MKIRNFLAGVLCVSVFTTVKAGGIPAWEEAILQSMKASVIGALNEQDDIRATLTPEFSTAFQLWLSAYPISDRTPTDRVLLALAPAVSKSYVNADPLHNFPKETFTNFASSAMAQQLFIPEGAGQIPYYLGLSMSFLNAFIDKGFYERFWMNPNRAIGEFSDYFDLGRGFKALACQYIFYDLSSHLFIRHINGLLPEDNKLNKQQQKVLARYLTHRIIWVIKGAMKDDESSARRRTSARKS